MLIYDSNLVYQGGFSVQGTVNDGEGGSSQPLTIVLVITVLALAPTLLIMLTAFTRIIIVFAIVRQAIGMQTTPSNQILVGLALFGRRSRATLSP